MDLQQYKLERHERFLTANLSEAQAKFNAELASMTFKERQKHFNDMMGWSLETPYSRELYNNPKDFRLVRRLRATEMIRMVFGYHCTPRSKKEWVPKLQARLRGSNMRDVRLICVDTDKVRRLPQKLEGEWKKRITSFHLGVAILDTRDMRDVIKNRYKLDNPSDLIRTYQFAVQDSVPEVEHFCFGDTEAISVEDLRRRFVEWQEGRDVIGVAYSVHNDFSVLKHFDIYLNHKFWIDVAQAQYIPLQIASSQSLAVMMNRLRIRYHGKLHIPGNDAHYTMRALLGTAVLDFYREWSHWGNGLADIPPWYDLATKIARAEVPRKERRVRK
ncbi:uncharacterized protein BKA55DRAFT_692040 [Fusarium redolens]|uniref:Gfd2/YDR514C-like C-terminal domain-containing protein n=1 Tax=Fusarium redolens TaxID=48865 RepID=A0A9P9K501_FUSRE|nr:uncharacterized protein BKA55DRAFT_692040 [Fusarium redolens]KAH7244230.1 hypothetical protein BKA55DRAFT_692040 [Fusarium redolens]